MLQLPQVTLCCVDGKNHAMALRALERSRRDIQFGRTIFLTDAIPGDVRVLEGIDVIPAGPITSHAAYSQIVLKGLYPHVATSHVLVIQWDGYVVNADLWDDDFLRYDYIGAPWPGGSVGNGGFSLRSARLLEVLQDESFSLESEAEDVEICGRHRLRLTTEFQIAFADTALARRFAFEMEVEDVLAGARTFGFHGVFNLLLVMGKQELTSLVSEFPKSIARSDMTHYLLDNLLTLGHYDVALALGKRILQVRPDNARAAQAVDRARRGLLTTQAANQIRREHVRS